MTTYPLRRAAAMLTGVALIAAETIINLSHIRVPTEAWHEQPLLIAVGIAGLAQAVAVAVMMAAWRERRWSLACLTAIGLAAAVAFSFSTTYERTASAREARAAATENHNAPWRVSLSRVASAKEQVDAECKKRGPECRKLEDKLTELQATLAAQATQRTVRQLGRLDMVPELALPIMLMLLGFAFLAFVDRPADRHVAASAQTSFPTDVEPPPANLFKPDVDDIGSREAMVTDFVREHVKRHGRAPRHRDVMRATGLPRATTSRYMRRALPA